jgi:O-antigen/teichoic acid export membrane protein
VLRRILQYGATMLGANVLVALFTFLVGMLGARERSLDAFGDYATYVLIYSIGQTIITSGANQAIQKFGADDRDRLRFAGLAYRGFLAVLLLSILVAFPVAWRFGFELALGFLAVPLAALLTWTRSIVRSRFAAKYEARLVVVASLSKSLAQLAFITTSDVEAALILGDFAGVLLTALFSFWFLARSVDVSIRAAITAEIGRDFLRRIVSFGWPLWVAGEVYTVRSSFVSSFTRAAFGARELGTLSMMEQIQKIAVKPSELFGQAALPGMVRAEADREEVYRRALAFALFLFPLLGIAAAGASPLILELFDVREKFSLVPELMMLAALVHPAGAVETTLLQYTVAEGKSRAIMVSQLFTVALLSAIFYPLGTAWGLYGVVATASIGHACYGLSLLVALAKTHPREVRASLSMWLRATLACTISVLVLYVFRDVPHAWLLAIPASLGYAALSLILGIRPTLS